MATTMTYEIHPAIGIARLGASNECFLAPEPNCVQSDYDQPAKITDAAKLKRWAAREIDGTTLLQKYRDNPGKLKRQAVRFRVFKVERDTLTKSVVTCQEMHGAGVTVNWKVQLKNRKAAALRFLDDRFDPSAVNQDSQYLRNPDVTGAANRNKLLVIDSKIQSPTGNDVANAQVLQGKFMDSIPVTLGHAWTDNEGRLLVAGGFGQSGAANAEDLETFADNDGWYDDTSDGTVTATVKVGGAAPVHAVAAHIIVAPFDFAPEINSFVTLYDAAYQAVVNRTDWPYQLPGLTETTDFTLHILPILERTRGYRWVNSPTMRADVREKHAAWKPGKVPDKLFTFLGDPTIFPIPNPATDDDNLINRAISVRKMFLKHLRDPDDIAKVREVKMPRLHDDDSNSNAVLPLTQIQYRHMANWAKGNGNFQNAPAYGEFLCDATDRVALEACSGGPFYPGMEVPRIMKDGSKYIAPFRFNPAAVKAGDITAGLAVPWQADFFECQMDGDNGWWPATRPDKVIVEQQVDPKIMSDVMSEHMEEWDNNVADMDEMVLYWQELGIVKRVPVDPAPRIADPDPGSASPTAGFLYIEDERTRDRERGRSLKP